MFIVSDQTAGRGSADRQQVLDLFTSHVIEIWTSGLRCCKLAPAPCVVF
jgi:hypothetical protein